MVKVIDISLMYMVIAFMDLCDEFENDRKLGT